MRDRTLKLIAYAGAANFAAFILLNFALGGDALNGRVSGGHYYLGSHGLFTEVSRAVYIYSACHATSGMLGIIVFIWAARTLKQRERDRPPPGDRA